MCSQQLFCSQEDIHLEMEVTTQKAEKCMGSHMIELLH